MKSPKCHSYVPVNLSIFLVLLIGGAFGFSAVISPTVIRAQKDVQQTERTPGIKKKGGATTRAKAPIYSPNPLIGNGERLFFGRTEGDGLSGEKSTIYSTTTTALSTPEVVTAIDELEPSFSSDGSKIVFVSRRDDL